MARIIICHKKNLKLSSQQPCSKPYNFNLENLIGSWILSFHKKFSTQRKMGHFWTMMISLLFTIQLLSLLGPIIRIEASPISNIPSKPEPLLIPLTRVTARKDSQLSQLPSYVLSRRGVQDTSSAYVGRVGMVGYSGYILIGTPPQRIAVLFDTGSDLVLTISDKCQGKECPELTHFSCSISSTCVDLGGDGSGNGVCGGGENNCNNNNSSNDVKSNNDDNTVDDTASAAQGIGHHPMKNVKNPKGTLGKTPPTSSESQDSTDVDPFDASKAHKPKNLSKTLSPIKYSGANDYQISKRLIGPAGVVKTEQSRHPLDTSDHNTDSVVGSSIKSPNPAQATATAPWTNYYNQSYVDGTWGAGTFVRDLIRVDITPIGQVYNPYAKEQNPNGHIGSSSSVTFLDVVQDNLELVRGYDGQISGLIGLSRSSPTGRKTFLQEMVEQGSLPMPVISMQLETEGSSFLFGGVNHSQYTDDLIYFPVTDPVIWQISLKGIGIRSTVSSSPDSSDLKIKVNINSSGSATSVPLGVDPQSGSKMIPNTERFQDAPLILDSGTSSILIPLDASEAIHVELSGTWDPIQMIWYLPCSGPDLVWWLSPKHAVIQPYKSLVYKLEDGSCQSLIFGNDAKYWILGDVWLRGLYVVFDMESNGRIGIASAVSPNLNRPDVDRYGSNGAGTTDTIGAARAHILTFKGSNSALHLKPSFIVVLIWAVLCLVNS